MKCTPERYLEINFNSTKVRLKLARGKANAVTATYFNSTKVRLKPVLTVSESKMIIFQFH